MNMINWENLGTAVMGNTVPYNPNGTRYEQKIITGVKELTRIRICRLPTLLLGGRVEVNTESPSGHYWIEVINDLSKMDGSEPYIESYGWYPQEPATLSNFFTVDGCLNSDCDYFREKDKDKNKGIPKEAGRAIIQEEDKQYSLYPFDPHHNKRYTLPNSEKREVNNPYIFATDPRTEEDIIEEIRSFARKHIPNKEEEKKKWSYAFENFAEYNCHTFLFNLLYETDLADRYILRDLHFIRFFSSASDYKDEYRYISDHHGNIFKIKNNETIRKQADEVYKRMKRVKDNAEKLANLLKK